MPPKWAKPHAARPSLMGNSEARIRNSGFPLPNSGFRYPFPLLRVYNRHAPHRGPVVRPPKSPQTEPWTLKPSRAAPRGYPARSRTLNGSELGTRTPMHRRAILTHIPLAALLIALAAGPGLCEGAARRPNIVFILADDLGYGDLGCYGQKMIQTPHLDRLAAEGMRFTDCYAGSTVCAPSRCVLMTGCTPATALIRGNARVPLEPEDVTVAKVLKQAGYQHGHHRQVGTGRGRHRPASPTARASTTGSATSTRPTPTTTIPSSSGATQEKVPLRNEVVPHDIGGRRPLARRRGHQAGRVLPRPVRHARPSQFVERTARTAFFLYLAFTIPHANNEAGNQGHGGARLGALCQAATGPSRKKATPP